MEAPDKGSPDAGQPSASAQIPPTPLWKRFTFTKLINLAGVVFASTAAISASLYFIRFVILSIAANDYYVSGKVFTDIEAAKQDAIGKIQSAGLSSDDYRFHFSRDSVIGPIINAPAGSNLDDLLEKVGATLKEEGGITCRAYSEVDVFCVRKGDYTHGGRRTIVGASLSQSTGSGFSSVISTVHKVDSQQIVLWFFRNQPEWWSIVDRHNHNAAFEFLTMVTVFTKPSTSTKSPA